MFISPHKNAQLFVFSNLGIFLSKCRREGSPISVFSEFALAKEKNGRQMKVYLYYFFVSSQSTRPPFPKSESICYLGYGILNRVLGTKTVTLNHNPRLPSIFLSPSTERAPIYFQEVCSQILVQNTDGVEESSFRCITELNCKFPVSSPLVTLSSSPRVILFISVGQHSTIHVVTRRGLVALSVVHEFRG